MKVCECSSLNILIDNYTKIVSFMFCASLMSRRFETTAELKKSYSIIVHRYVVTNTYLLVRQELDFRLKTQSKT